MDATVAGIVNNILMIIQTFKYSSHNLYFVNKLAIPVVSALLFQNWPLVQLVNVAFLLQDLHH